MSNRTAVADPGFFPAGDHVYTLEISTLCLVFAQVLDANSKNNDKL